MKAYKLSLAAALVAGSFGLAQAVSLEEAVRGVDTSGSFRYRYDSFHEKNTPYDGVQNHQFDAQLSLGIGVGDGFKVFGTLNYEANLNDGFSGTENANTKQAIWLKEAYLQYKNADFATTINLGRQNLNTIWTDNDNLGASAGMKAQLINESINGLTLTAFAVDSVNEDGDFIGGWEPYTDTRGSGNIFGYTSVSQALFGQNIYGAAALFDYTESAGVSAQLWYSYLTNRASLYMVGLAYELGFGESGKWGLEAQYLGNSPVSYLKGAEFETALGNKIKGGNLFVINASIEVAGFDANVGYSHYGKKDAFTFNVLEDMGDIITGGEEIQNAPGLSLHGDMGVNNLVFGGLGYTILDTVRVGVDYAWAKTRVNDHVEINDKRTTQEVVGRVEYPFSDKLVFSAFYSYVNQKVEAVGTTTAEDVKQNNIRFEARYDF